MLAKLVVHASSRNQAVRRLRDALQRYVVLGCTTNLSFLHWITEQVWFSEGRVSTGTLEQEWDGEEFDVLPENVPIAAAAYEMSAEPVVTPRGTPNPWSGSSGWRAGGAARAFSYSFGDTVHAVTLQRDGAAWRATVDGVSRPLRIQRSPDGEMVLRTGVAVWTAAVSQTSDSVSVLHAGALYRLGRPQRHAVGALGAPAGNQRVTAPMPGTLVKVSVVEGQHVTAHEPLVVLEAMKMEHVIEAPHEGIVREILYREGDLVPANEPVVRLEQA